MYYRCCRLCWPDRSGQPGKTGRWEAKSGFCGALTARGVPESLRTSRQTVPERSLSLASWKLRSSVNVLDKSWRVMSYGAPRNSCEALHSQCKEVFTIGNSIMSSRLLSSRLIFRKLAEIENFESRKKRYSEGTLIKNMETVILKIKISFLIKIIVSSAIISMPPKKYW